MGLRCYGMSWKFPVPVSGDDILTPGGLPAVVGKPCLFPLVFPACSLVEKSPPAPHLGSGSMTVETASHLGPHTYISPLPNEIHYRT